MPDLDTIFFLLSLLVVLGLLDLVLLGDSGVIGMILSIKQMWDPQVTGAEALVGQRARVVRSEGDAASGGSLRVLVHGEDWKAVLEDGASTPEPGAQVIVTAVSGLTLTVRPADD